MIQGGGSARVSQFPPVTPLAGLRERFGDAFRVEHERGCSSFKQTPVLDATVLDGPLQIAYYAGRERARRARARRARRPRLVHVHRARSRPRSRQSSRCASRARWSLPESGAWTFGLVQVGRARLTIDGEVVVDNWEPTGRSEAFMGFASAEVTATDRSRRRGARTSSRSSTCSRDRRWARWRSAARRPLPPICSNARLRSRARADVVVCVVGTDGDWETEGNDRESMALPPPQDELVRARRRGESAHGRWWSTPRRRSRWTGPTTSPRCCSAGSPGEEWGHALADVLSGDVTPSGKLPTTFPVRIEDTPAFTSYPGERGQVRYGEGVFVGYRWYDTRRIAPRFCFGHGLSYTTFALDPPARIGRPISARRATRRRTCAHRRRACATPGAGAVRRSCSATCTTSSASVARPAAGAEGVRQGLARPGEPAPT